MGIADTPWRIVVVVPQAQLYISVNGASKWLAWAALAGLALAGLLINMIGLRLVHSRTRLATLNADLQRLARVDVLTGLSNRRDIEETLIAALSAARRHQSSLAILLIDIVDGEAEGWPANVLIDTTVEIDDPPPGAREGAIARTPQLCARWSGSSPVGSRFRIRAGLVADWLTPSYQSTVGGKIARLHTVWVPSDCDADGWPGAPMRLIETRDVVRFLPQPGDESGLVAGLLIELVVQSNEIAGRETA